MQKQRSSKKKKGEVKKEQNATVKKHDLDHNGRIDGRELDHAVRAQARRLMGSGRGARRGSSGSAFGGSRRAFATAPSLWQAVHWPHLDLGAQLRVQGAAWAAAAGRTPRDALSSPSIIRSRCAVQSVMCWAVKGINTVCS